MTLGTYLPTGDAGREVIGFEPEGEILRLWWWFTDPEYRKWNPPPKEVLVEGPAGTGKSRNIAELIYATCLLFPGMRWIVFRKTRASLTESWLHTWEEEVVPRGHPILEGANRANRQSYDFPNGSTVVLGGMDKKSKLFSTQYAAGYCNEGQELYDEEDAQSIHRALRWKVVDPNTGLVVPRMLIQDCNPDAEDHQLNVRANEGLSHRIVTRHEDNPAIRDDEDYLEGLRGLPPILRMRLYEGKWVSAVGQVFSEWRSSFHLVVAFMEKREDGGWWLEIHNATRHGWREDQVKGPTETVSVRLEWFFGSMDFGYSNPGCLQLWGVDKDGICYRVKEVYAPTQVIDWWAEYAVDWRKTYRMRTLVCDSADPESIRKLNDFMGSPGGRDGGRIAIEATKSIAAGVDMVNWALQKDDTGRARAYLVADALVEADPTLAYNKKPTCTEREIPGYVWALKGDGKTVQDRPDPRCPDHGCDAMRYGMMWRWRRDLTPPAPEHEYEEGTYGAVLRHKERWVEIEQKLKGRGERKRPGRKR